MIGIYRIVNKVNGKFYIGSSVNCNLRKRVHFSKLRNKKHDNDHLQKSFNLYGEDNFYFEIILELNFTAQIERFLEIIEKEYILKLNPTYNNTLCTSRPGTFKNKKIKHKTVRTKEEISLIMSQKTKEHYNSLTPEQKAMKNKHKIGRIFTDETRKKLSEKAKQRKWSDEVRKKISNSMTKKLTDKNQS